MNNSEKTTVVIEGEKTPNSKSRNTVLIHENGSVRKGVLDNGYEDQEYREMALVNEVLALKELENTGFVPTLSTQIDGVEAQSEKLNLYVDLDKVIGSPYSEVINDLSSGENIFVMVAILNMIKEIHSNHGIIHKDLKPSNIIIDVNTLRKSIVRLQQSSEVGIANIGITIIDFGGARKFYKVDGSGNNLLAINSNDIGMIVSSSGESVQYVDVTTKKDLEIAMLSAENVNVDDDRVRKSETTEMYSSPLLRFSAVDVTPLDDYYACILMFVEAQTSSTILKNLKSSYDPLPNNFEEFKNSKTQWLKDHLAISVKNKEAFSNEPAIQRLITAAIVPPVVIPMASKYAHTYIYHSVDQIIKDLIVFAEYTKG